MRVLTAVRKDILHRVIIDNRSAIDPADGVEPAPSHGLEIYFSGDIVIETKKKALEEAKKYRAGSVVWVDGSKLGQGNAGADVCWKSQNRWENKSVFLGKNKEVIDAELWAIAIGLEIAGKITLDGRQTTPITIFSDSAEALNILGRSSSCASFYLRDTIFQNTYTWFSCNCY